MKKEDIGFVSMVLIAVIIVGIMLIPALTKKEITVEGNVIDVELLDNYFVITMDNGDSYKIAYAHDNDFLDLTTKSKIIIKMRDMNFFTPDGIWDLTQVIKVD